MTPALPEPGPSIGGPTTFTRRQVSGVLDGLEDAAVLVGTDRRILAANRAYRAHFGVDDPVGRHCYEVSHHFAVPCDQAGESCPLAQSRISGQRERVLHLHHTRRGEEYVNIELSPLPGADGQPAFYVEKPATRGRSGGGRCRPGPGPGSRTT